MENYKFYAQINSLCTAGEEVKKMFAEGTVKFKTVVGEYEKSMIGYPMYIDSENKNNIFAILKNIYEEDKEETDPEKKWKKVTDVDLILKQNYKVTDLELEGGKKITGKLTIVSGAVIKIASKVSSKILAIAKEKVDAGIFTEQEAEERLEYLRKNRVDETLMEWVVRGWRLYAKKAHKPSCLYVDPYTSKGEESIISQGLRRAVARFGLILEGDKSVGKNVYVETMAWLLGMPMYLITFSRQMSPSSIYGEKSTDNSAAEALAAFDPDILKKAEDLKAKRDFMIQHFSKLNIPGTGEQQINAINSMMDQILTPEENELLKKAEEFKMLQAKASSVNIVMDSSEMYDWLTIGGVMCFNEMNMVDANFFQQFANQILDGTGFLFMPGRGEVKINPNCVLYGTQNADYEGIEAQNDATVSRFGKIIFERPKTIRGQIEAGVKSMLKKHGFGDLTINPEYLDSTEKFYKTCLANLDKPNPTISDMVLNIRGFIRALTLVVESNGVINLKDNIIIEVINSCQDKEERKILTTALGLDVRV